jgi:predicted NBD/HSP70 family sugar kinase
MRRVELGQRSETVHRSNLSAIVRALHARGPLTRSELVARTGLTRSAIRRLIGELAESGFVVEYRSESDGAPGRPSARVHLVAERAVVLALEISVNSLGAAYVGLGGAILEESRRDRTHRAPDVAAVVGALADLARSLRGPWLAAGELVGVAVAVVGVVRREDGFVSMAPNLGWRDVPLGEMLAAALGTSVPLTVANEADLGVIAEHRRGAAVGVDDVVYISGDVGVGAGIVVDGTPLHGAAGYGGEVGHMPVNPIAGARCRCGSTGCWETEIGQGKLLARAGLPVDGGPDALESLLAAAGAGDERANAALDDVGLWLGIGLAGLVNTLDPSLIVLGGRFTRLLPFVTRRVNDELQRRALPAPRQLVRVVPAVLGDDAPVVGAAELAVEPLLADPARWFRRGGALRALATA